MHHSGRDELKISKLERVPHSPVSWQLGVGMWPGSSQPEASFQGHDSWGHVAKMQGQFRNNSQHEWHWELSVSGARGSVLFRLFPGLPASVWSFPEHCGEPASYKCLDTAFSPWEGSWAAMWYNTSLLSSGQTADWGEKLKFLIFWNSKISILINTALQQESSDFFCKAPESKCFRDSQPQMVSIATTQFCHWRAELAMDNI